MDIERLIAEVEARPVLYDCRIAGYTRKELKPKLWLEVARAVTRDWTDLDQPRRTDRVIEVQKRWRTVRDNFKRELNYQRSVENGEIPATKRKKYMYYDQLTFLEPIMIPSQQRFAGEYKPVYKAESGDDCPEDGPVQEAGEDVKQLMMDMLEGRGDSEELFLLSLVPALKRLDEHTRSLARLRIMQVIHELTYSDHHSETSCHHVIGPITVNCQHGKQEAQSAASQSSDT